MASKKGKCTNLAGCSLAYTKQPVSVPENGEFRCPECGQPLQPIEAGKTMKKPALAAILAVIAVLVAAAAAFLLWPKSHPVPATEMATAAGTPAATATPEMSSRPEETPAAAPSAPPVLPGTPAPASTPASVSQTDAQPEPQAAPSAPAAPSATPAEVSASTMKSPAATAAPTAPAADGNDESAQVKKEVLERIDLMPKLSSSDRTKLYEAVDRARAMSKLAVVPFEPGRTAPGPAAIAQLGDRLRSADTQRLIADPTVIVVVLGYADSKGSEKSNLQVSSDRAENLAKVLRDQMKVMNVLHPVGMGTSQLFSKQQLEKNRVAEVWAVLP